MAVFPHFNGFLGKIERNGARGSIPTAILHRKRYVWVTLLNFYFLPTAPKTCEKGARRMARRRRGRVVESLRPSANPPIRQFLFICFRLLFI